MKHIPVSLLSVYTYCPRQVYLSNVLYVKPEPNISQVAGLIGHFVRREIALRQNKILEREHNRESIEKALASELDKVLEEIKVIYRRQLSELEADYNQLINSVKSETQQEIKGTADRLETMLNEMGFEEAVDYITPSRIEYKIRSDDLGLAGRIDKVMKPLTPVEIKTGKVSENGVWSGDRLQVCAYSILLEDRHDQDVGHGFIEYTRAQEWRPVLNTVELRRQVLEVRDQVREVLENSVEPDVCPHGLGTKCKNCIYQDKCYRI